MRRGDGDAWTSCAAGHRHWGVHGASGLLLADAGRVLLQHRAAWSHEGGTWGIPGGARSSGEEPLGAALREATEEAGIAPGAVRPAALYVEEHGGWSYTTVLAEARQGVDAAPTDAESIAVAWVDVAEVPALPLHPAFAAAWPDLDPLLGRRLVLVVDVANVMGATPDGWWRDRAGAADRLLGTLGALVGGGVDAAQVALPGTPHRLASWLPDVVAVLEGRARAATTEPPGVRVVRADGSGDDAIVGEVASARAARPRDAVLVVTADRGLRRRVEALGADVAGPGLLRRLAAQRAGEPGGA